MNLQEEIEKIKKVREINRSKKNWIGIEINKVLEGDLLYFKSLQS